MYIGSHIKCLIYLSDFNETRVFSKKFLKDWNIKFY